MKHIKLDFNRAKQLLILINIDCNWIGNSKIFSACNFVQRVTFGTSVMEKCFQQRCNANSIWSRNVGSSWVVPFHQKDLLSTYNRNSITVVDKRNNSLTQFRCCAAWLSYWLNWKHFLHNQKSSFSLITIVHRMNGCFNDASTLTSTKLQISSWFDYIISRYVHHHLPNYAT